ncbi:MAG: DUF2334 domain-containing protein [Deltaproteobacteria bacterium]|nr:DUF2334 domain-containing protein [Deltaproteobacteria bacterium]
MLVVTIHDVAPPHLAAVAELRARARAWGATAVTLLAVPDYHGIAPLAESPETLAWLRACVDDGDEVALHGIRHIQDLPARRYRDRVRAALFTAGEGEMLGDGAADPVALGAARVALERMTNTRIDGFVAPAWLEPAGLGSVLARIGFRWHETGAMIESLPDRARSFAPVIGFATRSAWRERAARAWAALLTPAIDRWALIAGAPVRVALHPADLSSAAVMASAERVIRRLAERWPALTTTAALAAR